MKPSSLFRSLSLSLLILLGHSTLLFGQGTAFTYQGLLNNNGTPANGSYDLQFTLFPTNTTGAPLAGPLTNLAVPVSNGLFTVSVDFGNIFAGTSNWLELAVSTNAANTFSTLTPRQLLLPIPYAIFANSASNLLGNLPTAQLSGPIPITNVTGILPLAQLPPGVLTNTQTAVSLAGAFTGDGSGLTNSTPLAALGPNSVPGSNAVAAMIVALAPVGPGGSASNGIAINNGVGNNTTFNPNSGSGNVAITVNGTEVHGVTTNQAMLITQIGYETNINGSAHNAWSAGSYFGGIFDPIYCEGFNVAPGGNALVAGKQAWYHQREYNFWTGPCIYCEDHLDLVATNGRTYRPYQIDADISAADAGVNDFFSLTSGHFTFSLPYSTNVFCYLGPTLLTCANPSGTEGFGFEENGSGTVYLLPAPISANQSLNIGNGIGNSAWADFYLDTKAYGSVSLDSNGYQYNSKSLPLTCNGAWLQSEAANANDNQVSGLVLNDSSGAPGSRSWGVFNAGIAWHYSAHPGALAWNMSTIPGGDLRTSGQGGANYSLWDTNQTTWSQPTTFTNAGTGASTVIASNTISTGTILATNFTGNGGGLTNLHAAQISGTLPVATLPGLTTNVSTGGITFHITNGLIMRVTSP